MARPVDEMLARLRLEDAEFKRNAAESASVFTKLVSMFKKPSDLNLDKSVRSLSQLQNGINGVNINGLNTAIDTINSRFSILGEIGTRVLHRLTDSVMDLGQKMISSVSVDAVRNGFSEYELKIGNIQTILANTSRHGTTLQQVNTALDDLNTYADKTIYNFADMTRNIGLFTNAGLTVEVATSMIKGFSNEAAVSGANTAQAANAAYQLSQALSVGEIRLMDWRSLTNASMGNKNMQNGLIEIATAMGQFNDDTEGASKATEDFNGSLKDGWLSSEVMSNYLRIMAGDMDASAMAALGLSEAQITAFQKQQAMAEEAATKVRTFSQLIGTAQEALGSGWAKSFEIIFGGFDDATNLWTGINDVISGAIDKMADARNGFLQMFVDLGGRTHIIEGLSEAFRFLGEVASTVGTALSNVFPTIGSFLFGVANEENGVKAATAKAKEEFGDIQKYADEVIEGVYGNGEARVSALEALNLSYERIQDRVNSMLIPDYVSKFSDSGGEQLDDIQKYAEEVIAGVYGTGEARIAALEALGVNYERVQDRVNSILLPDYVSKFKDEATALGGAVSGVGATVSGFVANSESGVQQLVRLAGSFKDFFKNLTISGDTKDKLTNVFTGLFSVLDTGLSIISKVAGAFGGLLSAVLPSVGGFLLDVLDQLATTLIDINKFVTSNSLGTIIETIFTGIASMLGFSESSITKVITWFDKLGQSVSDMWNILVNDGPLGPNSNMRTGAQGAQGSQAALTGPFGFLITGLLALKDAFTWVRDGGIGTATVAVFSGLSRAIGWIGDKAMIAWTPVKNFIAPIIEATKIKVSGAFSSVVDWFRNIGTWASQAWPAVQRLWEMLKGRFSDAGGAAGTWLSDLAEGFGELGSTLQEWFGQGWEWVGTNLSGLWDWLKELAHTPDVAIDTFAANLGIALDNLGEISLGIGNFITDITDFLGKFDPKHIIILTALFGTFYTIKELIKLINTIKSPVTNVGEIVGAIKGLFSNLGLGFRDFGKGFKWVMFAASIGIIVNAMNKLADLDVDKIAVSAGAVGLTMLALVGSMKVLDKVKMNAGTAGALLTFSIAVKILAGVLKDLAQLDEGELLRGGLAMAAISLALSFSLGLLSMMSNVGAKIGGSGTKGTAAALLAMGASIWIIAKVIKDLGSIDPGTLKQGMDAALQIGVSIAVFAGINSLMSAFSSKGSGIGSAAVILALTAAIKIIAGSIRELGEMDTGTLDQGLRAIGMLAAGIGVFSGLAAFMSSLTSFGSSVGAAVIMGALVLSVKALADVVMELGVYEASWLQQGLVAVGILAGGMTVLASLLTAVSSLTGLGAAAGAAIVSGSIVLSVIALADVAMELGAYDEGSLQQGLIAVGILAGGMTVLSSLLTAVSSMTNLKSAASVAILEGGLVLSIMALADVVKDLGAYDPGQLNQGLEAVGILGLAVTAIVGFSSKVGGLSGLASAGVIIALAVGIKVLASAVIDLGSAEPEDVSQGLTALATGLAILIAAGAISTYFGLGLGLAALGAGAAGLGIGAAGVGIGLKAFAEALKILYDLLKEILGDLGGIIGDIIGFFSGLNEAIGEFLDGWVKAGEAIEEIAMADKVQKELTALETEFGLGEGYLGSAARTMISGITEAMKNGTTDVETATQVLVEELGRMGIEGEAALEIANRIMKAIMDEINGTDKPVASAGVGMSRAFDSVKAGIETGGAGALAAAKTWMANIRGALGVSLDMPAFNQSSVPTAPTPGRATAPKVPVSAQPVVDATPVDMGPSIATMASNALKMGVAWVTNIRTKVPESRTAGKEIAESSVQGVTTEAPRFLTTGITSGTTYVNAVKSTSGISRAAGNIIGVSATTGAKASTGAMRTTGSTTGGSFVTGVSSKVGNSRSAGSGLSNASRSGASGVSLFGVGSLMGAGFVSGIRSQASAAAAAGAALASAADSGARSRGQIKSPSRLTMVTGAFMGTGLILGIASKAKEAFNAGAKITSAAIDGVKSYANAFMEALEAEEAYAPVVRPVLDLTNVDSLNNMQYSFQAGLTTNGINLEELRRMNNYYGNPSSASLAQNISQNTLRNQNGLYGLENDLINGSRLPGGDVININVDVNNPTVADVADIIDIKDTVLRGIDEGLGRLSSNKAKGWAE